MNREEFTAGWALLEGAFGAAETPKARTYWTLLQALLPPGAFLAAAHRCALECVRFPTPKELMDRVPGHVDAKTAAESAWTRALDSAVHGPGDHSGITGWMPSGRGLDEEALEAAGGSRGLKRILDVSEDASQLGWMRREFLDRFMAQQANRAAGLLPDGRRPPALAAGEKERPAIDAPKDDGSTKRLVEGGRGRPKD